MQMQERECPLDTPLDTISLDSGEEDNDDRDEGKARLCSRRLTFLLTCLAPSADIVNIWRYPYIAYKHGGVGYAYSTLLALMSVYYMAILSWVLLYLFSSMQETLPWTHCATRRSSRMWNDAATQVALSLGTGTSLLQLLGRRGSKYRGLVHDAVIVILVNIIVSFFSGVVVFSCLGYVSKAINRTCIKFLQEGKSPLLQSFGTLFSVVPAALANLPGSVVCSILFFALLALLCLGRMEQMVLTMIICLLDKMSSAQLRKRYCLFVLGICGILFAAGIIFTTPAGIHILAVIDAYVFSWAAFLLGFLECVVVTWIYGFKQFSEDTDTILQQRLGKGWMFIWSFVTPGSILVILVFTIFGSPEIASGLFKNSFWGPILGWTLFFLVICPVPGYIVYKTIYTWCYTKGGRWDEFKRLVKPVPLCTKVMKVDKHTKQGKDLSPAPRILVIRKNDASHHGQLYIPYGFVVCPEKSPKSTRTQGNKLVFSFPDVVRNISGWACLGCLRAGKN
ncbi:hypothetical protein HPB47_001775 [Ixodes persulcatus]|uniref:Uncharacterized protein n=1 Tax=Ixodes persulcatus TaxID=34615 RepID=A0AC60PP94_IXOPE|nr:hypothetical protein HPB47_001775 [Ixodes persulcatus]